MAGSLTLGVIWIFAVMFLAMTGINARQRQCHLERAAGSFGAFHLSFMSVYCIAACCRWLVRVSWMIVLKLNEGKRYDMDTSAKWLARVHAITACETDPTVGAILTLLLQEMVASGNRGIDQTLMSPLNVFVIRMARGANGHAQVNEFLDLICDPGFTVEKADQALSIMLDHWISVMFEAGQGGLLRHL
jgi:hypothetical protein